MSNPAWIVVDLSSYLSDCPPYDESIDPEILDEVAQEVCRRFDYTPIYDQIDQYACQVLREKGIIKPAETLEELGIEN